MCPWCMLAEGACKLLVHGQGLALPGCVLWARHLGTCMCLSALTPLADGSGVEVTLPPLTGEGVCYIHTMALAFSTCREHLHEVPVT